jgi:hypothetical protein
MGRKGRWLGHGSGGEERGSDVGDTKEIRKRGRVCTCARLLSL